jgi:hypothetical protein
VGRVFFAQGLVEVAPVLAYTPGFLIFIGVIALVFVLAIFAAY